MVRVCSGPFLPLLGLKNPSRDFGEFVSEVLPKDVDKSHGE